MPPSNCSAATIRSATTDPRAVVVGVDGGGTTTRALCCNLEGHVLAHCEASGANPSHNADACQNMQAVLRQVIAEADRTPEDVRALVAGLAGLDHPKDLKWAEEFTCIDGLQAPRILLNDAQIAHAGALLGRPGIVSIAGTGSMTWAITEDRANFRDYDFGYYANGAARLIPLAAVQRILTGLTVKEDVGLINAILAHFQVASLNELCRFAATYVTGNDHKEMKRLYGRLAPTITDAAAAGIPLAVQVCQRTVEDIARAIGMLGSCFTSASVDVSLIGGVNRSPYFQREIPRMLVELYGSKFRILEPALSPLAGAILLALEKLEIKPARAISNLSNHPAARFS